MRRLKIAALLFLLTSPMAKSINQIPDKTLLWNKFLDVEAFDRILIALGENGIALFEPADSGSVFIEKSHVVLASPSKSLKLQDLVLVVRQLNDTLVFIDFHRIDSLTILGRLKPDFNYFDYAHTADRLFLSRWFEGIDVFRITYYQDMEFLDKLNTGVLFTQLEMEGRFLRALDLYNGVVSHDLRDDFEPKVTKLLLNERPFVMSVRGESAILSTNSIGATIARIGIDSAYVIDKILDIPTPDKVHFAGNYLASVSDRAINVIKDHTYETVASLVIEAERTTGSLSSAFGGTMLLLPKNENGVTGYRVPTLDVNLEVLHRPGPINAALLVSNSLFSGGGGNPLEMYGIVADSLLPPVLMRANRTGVSDVNDFGGLLYVLYGDEQKVFVISINRFSCAIESLDSFSVSIAGATGLNTFILPDDSTRFLAVGNRNQIEVFAELSDSFEPMVLWTLDRPIADATVLNGTLYVTDRFESITAYTIQSDFSLTKCSERNLTGTGWAMEEYGSKLFVFTGNTLTVFDDCLVLDTIVRLSSFVLETEIESDTLYTVGPDGIAKYDLFGGLPALVEIGGLKGSQISVDNGNIATTDGSSINLYFGESNESDEEESLAQASGPKLYENYPEPFNSSTTIQFELASSSYVELSIFNLLGQQVRKLSNKTFEAGVHSISWDGKDELGGDVSSGIYFYRLLAGSKSVSKKMLLIK